MSGPIILFVLGRLRSPIPTGVQGMVPVSWFDFVHCLLRLPLVPSEQVSLVGWPQSALAAPVREEWKAGFLWGPRSETRGRSRKRCFGPGLSDRRDCPEAAGAQSECSGRRGEPERLTSERLFLGRPSGRRPDYPSGQSCLRLLGRPTNYMLFS